MPKPHRIEHVGDSRSEAVRWYRDHGPICESFPEQVAAVRSQTPKEAWQCDRRAGKTSSVALRFHEDGRDRESDYVYIAKTRQSAKDITWREFKKFARRFDLGWRFYEQELAILQKSGSQLKLYGADNPDWIDRLHGRKLREIDIDEAAFWKIDLKFLIDDVLDPCVADEEGFIRVMSRPGHINAGFFWEVCAGKHPDWSVRKWSWKANPYVNRQVQKRIDMWKKANPEIENDPSFRRNWCNEWVDSVGERVYPFDLQRNGLEAFKVEPGDRFVLGLDLGWHDSTAFSLCTYGARHPHFVELESYTQTEMPLDHVAQRLRLYCDEYPNLIIVGDPERKQSFEEVRRRTGLPIQPALKTSKRDWVDLVNNDLLNGMVQVVDPRNSPHVEEMLGLVWEKRPSGEVKEKPGRPNDACDAFLYAYRHSYHWRHEAAAPPKTEAEQLQALEKDYELAAEQAYYREQQGPWHD